MINVNELFGEIDIYLFDQILKGRFPVGTKILDAGCSGGRNLVYFFRGGYEVFAVDENPAAIEYIRFIADALAPQLPKENFRVAAVEQMPFPNDSFDAVISNAVLHFASSENQFFAMLEEMWRVLKPGGLFFARLASTIGIEDRVELIENRIYLLPDGSERFLADENLLNEATERLGGIWLEPLKTTNVQNLRCMSTWVLVKNE